MEYRSNFSAILLIVFVNVLLVDCYLEKEDLISDVETSSPVNDYAWTYEDGGDELVTPRQVRVHPAYRHRLHSRRAFAGENQRVQNDGESLENIKEPTCEELKNIWKLSKQAALQSLSNNEIPTYAPAGTFGHIVQSPGNGNSYGRVVMQQPAKSGTGTKYVHGRKIYHPDERSKSGDSLRRRTAGSYEKLEEQLRYGLFNRFSNKNRHLQRGDEDERPIVYGAYKSTDGLTEQSGKHHHRSHNKNIDRNSREEKIEETDRELSETENTGCKNLVSQKCHSSNACSCFYGLRTCLAGKCKKLKSKNQVADVTHTRKSGDAATDSGSIPRNAYQIYNKNVYWNQPVRSKIPSKMLKNRFQNVFHAS